VAKRPNNEIEREKWAKGREEGETCGVGFLLGRQLGYGRPVLRNRRGRRCWASAWFWAEGKEGSEAFGQNRERERFCFSFFYFLLKL